MFSRRQKAQPSGTVSAGVSREDIVASIEMILGRTPDEALVDLHLRMGFKDRFALGDYMLSTAEFRNRHKSQPQPVARRQPLFLGDRLLCFTRHDQPIFLVPDDLDITPWMLFDGGWEADVEFWMRASIKPGDIAIDIGSNVGVHTLTMAACVGPEGRVHAFEANPAAMKLLRATMFINLLTAFDGTGRVTLHECAASDRAGRLILEQAPGHFGSGHLVTADPGSDFGPAYSARVEVPTVAIDELLGDKIPRLDFLHMDIEGAEPLAMQGARALIARSPTLRILCEWSVGMMVSLANVQDHIDWLAGEGFRFWRIEPYGVLVAVAVTDLLQQPHCDMFISRQDPPSP